MPSGVQAAKALPKKQNELKWMGTHGVLSPDAPVLRISPQHHCTHTSRAVPLTTQGMIATIAFQEIQPIYGQTAIALPG